MPVIMKSLDYELTEPILPRRGSELERWKGSGKLSLRGADTFIVGNKTKSCPHPKTSNHL